MTSMRGLSAVLVSALILITAAINFNGQVDGHANLSSRTVAECSGISAAASPPLMVGLTLVRDATSKGAVCLDGTSPGYHLHRGYGQGGLNWVIFLEGGGWCNSNSSCVYRKTTARGSSKYMERELPFTGILSNNAKENPDFYNWNRVKIRYCDGASFTGNKSIQLPSKEVLEFRGQAIWLSIMHELLQNGMQNARQALLTGCSAGGLASIIHCDEFKSLLPLKTRAKCLSDAGLFLDAVDVSGHQTLKIFFEGVVQLHSVHSYLPHSCTKRLPTTMCFFPQNLIGSIKTPLFLVNAAYDSWQVQVSLTPAAADPKGLWRRCRANMNECADSQIKFLQGFRSQMVNAVRGLLKHEKNGVFLNSCFAHCQTEKQDTWFQAGSPTIRNKRIAEAVGDWYFDRRGSVKDIDSPYPVDSTCHNQIFRQ